MDDMSNTFVGFVDNCNNLCCENMARIMCERCSEGYCSIVCQKKNWRQHKKTCIPFPGVVPYESPYLQGQSMLPQQIIHNRKSSTVNIMWSSATASPIQVESPLNAQKLLETPQFQGKSLSSIGTASLGPKSDIKVKIEGSEPELQVKRPLSQTIEEEINHSFKSLSISATPIDSTQIHFGKNGGASTPQRKAVPSITAMPTIGENIEVEGATTTFQGKLPLNAAQSIASAPILFGKKAAQAQGKATSITAMPTIGKNIEGATTTLQVKSSLKAAQSIDASAPTLFGKKAPQAQEKPISITAIPTIGKNTEEASTTSQGKSTLKAAQSDAASAPILFGKKAALAQGKPTVEVKLEGKSPSTVAKPVSVRTPKLSDIKRANLQEKTPLATAELPCATKSTIWKVDEVLTTKKATPLAAAASSMQKPLATTEEWKTSYESEFMKFLPFRIQHVNKKDPKNIWIVEERNMPQLEALKSHMQKFISENHQPCRGESIAEGMLLFGLRTKTEVYRVNILQNLVQQKKVYFQAIDYGKKGSMDYNNLYNATPQSAKLKTFAFPVEIQGKTYGLVKPDAKIHMRLIEDSGVGGLIKAEIQYESFEKIMQMLSLYNHEIKILKISVDGQSALVQCPYLLDVITEDLAKAMGSSDLQTFTLTEETFLVAAHTVDGWRRAVIIDSLTEGELHLIYAIDEGCLKVSDTLQCLPDKLTQFPTCAFAMTVKRAKVDLKEIYINNQLAKFEIQYESNTKLFLYCDSQKIGQVYLKSYFDDEEFCNKLAINEINANGSNVYITKLINHGQVYINLPDSTKYPALFELLVPKCSKYMKERPLLHDIVLVKTEEKDYYRGEIILLSSDENDAMYEVFNIDSGETHKFVHIETMYKPCNFIRYLPKHLQKLDLTMLHAIPAETLPTTSAILHRLNEYIQEGTQFKVEYIGNSFNEGNLVFLNKKGLGLSTELLPLLNRQVKEKSTSSLPSSDSDDNDANPFDEEIFKSLPPSLPNSPQPEAEAHDPENLMEPITKENPFQSFTLQDVQIKKLPSGQNIDIVILDDSNVKTYGYYCCTHFETQADADEFQNNMDKVHAYGQCAHEEIPENYIPEIDEICVALSKDDDRWYRAHCMSHDGDDMISIMFLDFGNVQKTHKSEILPLTKDLLYPVYANFCYIDGYKVGEPNTEVDKYIKNNRLRCRQIIDTGVAGFYKIKLGM